MTIRNKIWELLQNHPKMTSSELASHFAINRNTVRGALVALRKENKVVSFREDGEVRYRKSPV